MKIFFYSVICFGLFYIIRVNGPDIIHILSKMHFSILITLIFLQIPVIIAGGWAFQFLCTPYRVFMPFKDWAGLSFIANFLNQLLPYRPGLGFRYFYLQQNYQMKISEFIYATLMYFILMVFTSTVFAILGWGLSDIPKEFNIVIFTGALATLVLVGGLLWLSTKDQRSPKIKKYLEAFYPLIENPKLLFWSLFGLAIMNLLITFIFYLTFHAVSLHLPFTHCLLIVGILTLSMIFPVTPGNIGVLETIIGSLTLYLYQDFTLGFVAVALYRATQWVPSVILSAVFSLILLGRWIPQLRNIRFGRY